MRDNFHSINVGARVFIPLFQ